MVQLNLPENSKVKKVNILKTQQVQKILKK